MFVCLFLRLVTATYIIEMPFPSASSTALAFVNTYDCSAFAAFRSIARPSVGETEMHDGDAWILLDRLLKNTRVCCHGNLEATPSHQHLLSNQKGCAHPHVHAIACPASPVPCGRETREIVALLSITCSVTASILVVLPGGNVQRSLLTCNNTPVFIRNGCD